MLCGIIGYILGAASMAVAISLGMSAKDFDFEEEEGDEVEL